MELDVVRADPAGNVTLLVLTAVPAGLRARAAAALMERYGGEQVGFLTPPRLGGQVRLEMMGGEFCGNAARAAGYWQALTAGVRGRALISVEVGSCAEPLAVLADTAEETAQAEMPLPSALETWESLPAAVFPGIVHVLCADREPEEDHARRVTRALTGRYGVGAAGVLYLRRADLRLRPAVYVRDTETLCFESSCASGSAACAALLSAGCRDGAVHYDLAQPGGVIRASAVRRRGELVSLTVGGALRVGTPFRAELALSR